MPKRLLIPIFIGLLAVGMVLFLGNTGKFSPQPGTPAGVPPETGGNPTSTAYASYGNPFFLITLRYPAAWQPDTHYPKIQGIPTHFSGPDGFFSVDTIGGRDVPLSEIVGILASTTPPVFGTAPATLQAELDGQPGVFIYPSDDQSPDQKNGAAFIVRYPKPISYDKKTLYYYVLLSADKAHIQDLAKTMEFLPTSAK